MALRQIVLDTETTGLEVSDGHRLIEIGAVELVERQLTGKQFHYYLNPQRSIEEGALEVHGISEEFLQDKPLFANRLSSSSLISPPAHERPFLLFRKLFPPFHRFSSSSPLTLL